METKLGAGPCALAEVPRASEKPTGRLSRSPKVLLTSVCRPLGATHGDAPSVGFEVLHGQVTRAQGVFSPRSVNFTYGLDYIAANIDAPAVVLQYPSHRELIRELKKGPDYVGVSFNLVLFHRMKEVVALVRKYAPRAKIVLGGYGTVLDDATLAPYGDYFCRGEGVAFFRALLNEPPRPMPYDHPLVMLNLKVFSVPMDRTGVIFAGLGCPNGCDFCCTSHYFKRRHIRLLPTGDDIFRVVERYLEVDPRMSMAILDEDFLLAKDRATRMRELVLARGTPLSIFSFASVKALSRFTPQELLETGVDGVWVGFEGKRSGYSKQQGKPIEELIPELRSHGITVLSSMILGFDYHTPEIIREEMREFLALRPTYGQFLIYGPTPGTPFYERIMKEGRMRPEMLADPERYYRNCDGFTSMVVHPTMKPGEIEALQRECFDTDYRLNGPSILRSVEVWFQGWKRYCNSSSAYLRAKAERWKEEIHFAWPLFRVAKLFGPLPEAAVRLEAEVREAIGAPPLGARVRSLLAPAAAAWTGFTLRHDLFQQPKLVRNTYRTSPWALRTGELGSLRVSLERVLHDTRVKLEGALDRASAKRLAASIRAYLHNNDADVKVVVAEGTHAEFRDLQFLARELAPLSHRVSIAVSSGPETQDYRVSA
ncbi:MAG: cobalamin-dependent protein [Terriglobia bacterium]